MDDLIDEMVKLAIELSKKLSHYDPISRMYHIQMDFDLKMGEAMRKARKDAKKDDMP